jgi:hypothetical protein
MNREELLRTHHLDPKSGRIVKVSPYRLRIRDGVSVFEKEGNFYTANGDPVDPQTTLMAEEIKLKAMLKNLEERKAKLSGESNEQSGSTVSADVLQSGFQGKSSNARNRTSV